LDAAHAARCAAATCCGCTTMCLKTTRIFPSYSFSSSFRTRLVL
jgi:hypothetical protein